MKSNIHTARKLSLSYRFIDDLLMFNTAGIMDEHRTRIYPKELILNRENDSDQHCTFLDLNITLNKDKTITTSIYDKRDDFNFDINSLPNLSGNIHTARSHGIVVSQLLRFCNVCNNVTNFLSRTTQLVQKLTGQFFVPKLLRQKVSTSTTSTTILSKSTTTLSLNLLTTYYLK